LGRWRLKNQAEASGLNMSQERIRLLQRELQRAKDATRDAKDLTMLESKKMSQLSATNSQLLKEKEELTREIFSLRKIINDLSIKLAQLGIPQKTVL